MEDAVVIVNERVVSYINSLDRGNSDICNIIEKEAIEDQVPIIRKEMGNLLKGDRKSVV